MQITARKLCTLALPILILSAGFQPTTAQAEGTAFTYQGRLNSGGSPANGSYDIAFTLYPTNTTGSAVAGPVTNPGVTVSNGLFTTAVDFGPYVFTGTNYWLEIAVSTNGADAFTTLAPRQPLTPTPYAIFASDANNVLGPVSAAQLTGAIPSGDISGNYSGQVNFNNGADTFDGTFFGNFLGNSFIGGTFTGQFIGDGSGLININPAHISGQVAYLNSNQVFTAQNVFMQSIGLGNTNPLPFYAIDALEPQADFRLQTTNSGNGAIIELWNTTSNNFSEYLGAINFNNAANSYPGQIGYFSWPGGTAPDYFGLRVGGWDQSFKLVADPTGNGANSLINGGLNSADTTNGSDFIGSGAYNGIHSGFSAIIDGYANTIQSNMPDSFIGGGYQNSISITLTNPPGFRGRATIGGGQFNQANGFLSFVGGGLGNTASGIGSAVLGGGVYQYTGSNGLVYYFQGYGTAGGLSSTVLGGVANLANGDFSTAGGYIAQANHSGTWVWADSQFPNTPIFSSTTSNEFSIRAQNGIRVVTDKGIHLNTANEPIIVRDWDVFATNAPGDKAGIGRWGLFMEPYNLTIGIPDTNNLPDSAPRFFQVASYATNGSYTTLMSVDQFGNLTTTGTINGSGGGLTGLNASQLSNGILPANVFAGNYTNPVTLTNPANFFAGNGSGLTGVNAALLNGLPASSFAPASGSANYIQNQSGTSQAASFNINGNATIGGNTMVNSNAQVTGYLRLGSETNAASGPNYPAGSPGLVIRRIASTGDGTGSLVARTDQLQLQRDGTVSGLQMAYNATGFQTINAFGITTNGTTVVYRNTIRNASSGTLTVFTDSQKVIHYDISFGNIYNAGHSCHVVLDRYDDGTTSDFYLVGTVTTTYNQ